MFVGTGKPRKPKERAEARALREQGMSYKRIADALSISPSSAFNWTKDILLTPEQVRQNLYGPRGPQSPEHIARHVSSWRKKNRLRRARYQAEGRAACWDADPLHLAGCLLYWAEGSKARNCVTFCNSEVAMVRFFKTFLTESFGLTSEDFTVRLNVYLRNGMELREIEDFWLDQLGLPRTCLRKHSINHFPTSSSGKKTNRLPYGVCSLRVLRSTKIVQHIYGAIQEYAGFVEPSWLDGPPKKSPKKKSRRSADE
jgi:hypothetical protein